MGNWADIFKEIYEYISTNKKWWLIPALIALLVAGFLVITVGTAPVPVFVYPVA